MRSGRDRVSRLLGSLAVVTGLAGCVGSAEPYRPGHQPRPQPPGPPPTDTSVPIAVARTSGELERGIRDVRRIFREIHANPWDAYETDLVGALGPELAERALGRPPVRRAPPGDAAPTPTPRDAGSREE